MCIKATLAQFVVLQGVEQPTEFFAGQQRKFRRVLRPGQAVQPPRAALAAVGKRQGGFAGFVGRPEATLRRVDRGAG